MQRLIEFYLAERFARDELADASIPVVRSVLRRWTEHVADKPMAQWDRRDVQSWIARPDLRPSTRKSMLTKLRPFVQWLVERDLIRRDITAGVRAPKIPRGAPRDLDPDAVTALVAVCPDARARLMVLLMVHLGLRCGDLARVWVSDIDRRRRVIEVRGKGGRGEQTHSVPISDEAWTALDGWLTATGYKSGALIRSYQPPHAGLTPHTISRLVVGWMRAAGLKEFPYDGVSAHALRHTTAQHMLDGGADLREVQFGLGHASMKSTEIYTRREPPGLRSAMGGRHYLDVIDLRA